MARKPYLVVALLAVGIVVGLGVSTLVTYTVDQGVQRGPLFSLAHHISEFIGFLVLSIGIGLGFDLELGAAKWGVRILGAAILIFYSILAVLQFGGMQLPIGVPFFIPVVIGLGFIAGYLLGRRPS